MAAIYPHKKAGREVFQVRFNLYLADGNRKTIFRYRRTKDEAAETLTHAEFLEKTSRNSALTDEEVAQAQRLGLIKADVASRLARRQTLPIPAVRQLGTVVRMVSEGRPGAWTAGQIMELLGEVCVDGIHQETFLRIIRDLVRPSMGNTQPVVLPFRRTLSDLVMKYTEMYRGVWRFRTAQKPQEYFSKIVELLGNVYTDQINQDMLIWLFDELSRYPKWRNHPHQKSRTLRECREHPDYEPIGLTTFFTMWNLLGALLTFGAENGEFGIERNFCRDKIFAAKKKALAKARKRTMRRLPYEISDIQSLMHQLGEINKRENPQQFWIPLIGLFSGMRQGEICQLYCDDIIAVGGVHCFRLCECQERKQHVKTEQSERVIPIHPTLLQLGFLDFVASRHRHSYERLWQGVLSSPVEYYERQDTYGHYFEKWYNGTFRKRVIYDATARKQKPFHSLRHTFINWFFQNIPSQQRDNAAVKGLVGHLESEEQKLVSAVLKGISWDTYSQGLNPARLLETLSLLDYGVDLSPLKLPVSW